MKIFFIISTLGAGGAERVMTSIASEANKSDQTLLITRHPKEDSFYYPNVPTKYIYLRSQRIKLYNSLHFIFSLIKLIKQEKPDKIISFITETNLLVIFAVLICKLFRIKTNLTISERVDPRKHPTRKIISSLRHVFYRFSDRLVIQTENLKEWALKIVDEKKIMIIPNPIDIKSLIHSTSPCFQPPFQNYILNIGRLEYQKGHDILIRALAILKNKEICLCIIGDGPKKELINKLIYELNLEERVKIIPRVNNITDYILSSNLFVLSSRYEGYPNVLLEAVCLGKASISFDCQSGPSEILIHDCSKYLVKDINEESLANMIDSCLSDMNRDVLFDGLSKMIIKNHSITEITKKWLI